MKSRPNWFFPIAILVLSIVLSIISYPVLPAKVPIHWGFGNVRYGSKLEVTIIFPGLILLVLLLRGVGKNAKLSENKVYFVIFAIQIFLFLFYMLK